MLRIVLFQFKKIFEYNFKSNTLKTDSHSLVNCLTAAFLSLVVILSSYSMDEGYIEMKEFLPRRLASAPPIVPLPDKKVEPEDKQIDVDKRPIRHLTFHDLRDHVLQIPLGELSPRTTRQIIESARLKGASVQILNRKTTELVDHGDHQQFLSDLHAEDTRHYPRILSIDGGGMRGIIAARVLKEIEIRTQKKLYELFDVIIGVSTGSLIIAGIAKGLTADEIIEHYLSVGPKIFSVKYWSFRGMLGAVYSPDPYREVLSQLLGDMKLGDCKIDSHFVTYNQTLAKGQVFKSSDPSTADLPLSKVVRASSAAQTYFPPEEIMEEAHLDGGGYKNNPTGLALTYALRKYKVNPEECIVVSIGTGISKSKLSIKEAASLGLIGCVTNLINVFLDGESDHDLASELMTLRQDKSNPSSIPPAYYRFQFELPPEHYTTERTDNLEALLKIAEGEVVKRDKEIDEIAKVLLDPRSLYKRRRDGFHRQEDTPVAEPSIGVQTGESSAEINK